MSVWTVVDGVIILEEPGPEAGLADSSKELLV
jgi:hypothetical protein